MGRMEVWSKTRTFSRVECTRVANLASIGLSDPRAMRGGPTSFNGERMVMQSDGWAFWPNTGTNGHDQETKDRETMTVDQAKAYCRSNDDWCVGFEYGTGAYTPHAATPGCVAPTFHAHCSLRSRHNLLQEHAGAGRQHARQLARPRQWPLYV